MSRRTEVQEAIRRILVDEVPEVADWQTRLVGIERGTGLVGGISCDRVAFATAAKGEREATATYSIYLIDYGNSFDVDALADKADAAFAADPSLDGWATDSRVKRILYGAAPTRAPVCVACLELEVKYDMRETAMQ